MAIIDERIIELPELRIGNILEYKGEIVRVTTLSYDIDDEYEETIGFVKFGTCSNEHSHWNRALVNDLKRIPLGSEWLERFGFKQSPPGSIGNLDLDLPDNNELEYSYVDKLITFNGMVLPKSPEHVHQLQNLYFALTGEELAIKEKI